MKTTRKVFVAYANDAMTFSLHRIGRQARKLGIFDDVILYTPKDLPEYILKSPLMQYAYGGGYWAWKPCVIYETLQKYEDDTIVCYVDAGCTLKKRAEWDMFFELMREYDTLCFKYRDEMPCWERFGAISTRIECWTKKQSAEFYDSFSGSHDWRYHNKIWGGCLFMKGKQNAVLQKWLEIELQHPEVILDPQKDDEQESFFAQHKHDQSLLTVLASMNPDSCIVLPEISETCGEDVAIYASRIRARGFCDYCMLRFKYYARRVLGNKLVDRIKR